MSFSLLSHEANAHRGTLTHDILSGETQVTYIGLVASLEFNQMNSISPWLLHDICQWAKFGGTSKGVNFCCHLLLHIHFTCRYTCISRFTPV